ncbi:PepSY-associated TM helix domain-containing protein [Phenylobacterium terrae]|uniref:PepSY-associated TM helix domain-containing protein n=1 Tax=Phenylobacterium terrae TaxID=2665495 RepID=A0ABW4MZC0_9CAUL
MSRATVKGWYLVHKWTSLVCTAFLLMLCITGLPLIFYHEIEHLLGRAPEAAELAPGTAPASLDAITADALARRPGEVVQYVSFEEDEPVVYVTTAPTIDAVEGHIATYDGGTGQLLDVPPLTEGVMYFLFRLHYDMFAGLPGTLFLGLMGGLFVAAIVSGVVVYAPFMRRLPFGAVREGRSARIKWLDLHNLLGVTTMAWALVVGGTGLINTLATPILHLWQADQLAEMTAPYRDKPPATNLASVNAAVETARAAAPGMTPQIVAYPGTPFSSRNHYAVFMHGETPLTSRVLKPALIDAETGQLTAMRDMPWYAVALFVSQPLHFGDYGGMPMKILWALLTVVTIVVLGSGLYLWLGRRRTSVEARLAELERGAEPAFAMREAAE